MGNLRVRLAHMRLVNAGKSQGLLCWCLCQGASKAAEEPQLEETGPSSQQGKGGKQAAAKGVPALAATPGEIPIMLPDKLPNSKVTCTSGDSSVQAHQSMPWQPMCFRRVARGAGRCSGTFTKVHVCNPV